MVEGSTGPDFLQIWASSITSYWSEGCPKRGYLKSTKSIGLTEPCSNQKGGFEVSPYSPCPDNPRHTDFFSPANIGTSLGPANHRQTWTCHRFGCLKPPPNYSIFQLLVNSVDPGQWNGHFTSSRRFLDGEICRFCKSTSFSNGFASPGRLATAEAIAAACRCVGEEHGCPEVGQKANGL